MDAFKVPKKVNRHVLKALNVLSSDKTDSDVSTSMILNQVKYQMRNLVPIPNINMVIRKSLKNLSDIGLIDRTAPGRFAIGRSYAPSTAPKPNKPKTVNRSIFKPSGSRKRSKLNPNFKRTQFDSEESLSGDEYDRSRKRMRTNNKKLNYSGHSTELPKARQHFRFKNIALADPLTRPSPLYMRDYGNDSGSDQSFEKAVSIGPTMSSNTDLNLAYNSPTQPLEINEIPCEDHENNLKQMPNESPLKVVELFKSTRNSYDSVEAAGTNSNTLTNTPFTGQPSKTCIVFSFLPRNENTKTSVSVSKTIFISKQGQPSKTSVVDSNVSGKEKSKTSVSTSKFKTISIPEPGQPSKTSVIDSNVSRKEKSKTSVSASKFKTTSS